MTPGTRLEVRTRAARVPGMPRRCGFIAAAALALCACVAPSLAATSAPAAKPATNVPLANPGFEEAPAQGRADPPRWASAQHAGDPSYTFTLDEDVHHEGARSLRIENIGREPYGVVYQSLPAAALRGRTARFAGWLRTRDAGGTRKGLGASLTLQAMKSGIPVAHNHMIDATVSGTHDWKRYDITLDVPADAETVEIGAMLRGPGALWLDDVELAVLPKP